MDATDANAIDTKLRANRPTPKYPPTNRQDLKHERTLCSGPSGRPPKPPNMRRHTHAGASRRSPTHAAEGVVAVAVVVVRHAVERRTDQPAAQASRQASNEQTNHHNQTNKQTKDAAAAVSFLRTTTRHNTMDTLHCHLPAHLPTHAHPRPPVPQQRGRHRRERHQHEAPGEPSNTPTPANQAARSKARTHALLAPRRTSVKGVRHMPPHTRRRVAT